MGSNGGPGQIAEGDDEQHNSPDERRRCSPPRLEDLVRTASPTAARQLSSFADILQGRRSDLLWVSKEWRPTPMTHHARTRSPAKIRQDVVSSAKMQHTIEQLSTQNAAPKDALWKELDDILVEMGHTQTLPVVRWFGYMLSKIMRKIYKGVYVNEESIARMRASIGQSPVIFMPSHRSYADFLILSYVCFHYNITLPVIAAGMDFVSMWGIGRLLRDCGAFFIRRSFGNDKLYWAAFSEYVQTLVTAGENPVEFFVEGTRSRSAKSLCPKLGLLSVALEPYFTGQVSDVMLVPISISYDRTLEEILYSYELLGVPKPKESTSGLFKALNVLDEQYGRIHIDFTKPIMASEFFGDLRSPKLLRPLHLQHELSQDESTRIVLLANHVVRQQQQYAVISLFSLTAIFLAMHAITKPNSRPLLFEELLQKVATLKRIVESYGALVDCPDTLEVSLRNALEIHKSLVVVSKLGEVQIKNVVGQAAPVDPKLMKGHTLQNATLQVGVPIVMLQHYINQTLHLFVCPAAVALSAQHSVQQGSGLKEDVFAKYQFLRALLSHEFILHKSWERMDFETSISQLTALNVLEERNLRLCLGSNWEMHQMLLHLLHPFLAGYFHTCQTLKEVPAGQKINLNQSLKASQARVEELVLRGEVSHHYALSLEILTAAVNSLAAAGALNKIKDNGKVLYSVNESRLDQVSHVIGEFLQLVSSAPSGSTPDVSSLVTQERAKL